MNEKPPPPKAGAAGPTAVALKDEADVFAPPNNAGAPPAAVDGNSGGSDATLTAKSGVAAPLLFSDVGDLNGPPKLGIAAELAPEVGPLNAGAFGEEVRPNCGTAAVPAVVFKSN